jgi:response regulator RpfG family c-di-GMP phosphodiesterase
MIEMAAPLYDLGKIGLPDAILHKAGPLSAEERKVVERHTQMGHDILRESSSRFVQLAASIALHHHERHDGRGYPSGLAGEDIPVAARIVGLVDMFDAMTCPRPWRPAHTVDTTVREIRAERARRFAPDLIDAFEQALARLVEIRQAFDGHAALGGQAS